MIVTTLSLGIGANTAIFTLVNEIVLRPLPIGDPSEVVDIFADVQGGNSFTGFSYPDFMDYRDRNGVLTDLAVFTARTVRLRAAGGGESISVQFASVNYFDLLQVRPPLGRGFRPEDGIRGGAHAVAIVSHGYWQRRAGEDPAFLGSTILLNETVFTVIGIAPEGFQGTFTGFPRRSGSRSRAGSRSCRISICPIARRRVSSSSGGFARTYRYPRRRRPWPSSPKGSSPSTRSRSGDTGSESYRRPASITRCGLG